MPLVILELAAEAQVEAVHSGLQHLDQDRDQDLEEVEGLEEVERS